MTVKNIFFLLLGTLLLSSCVEVRNQYNAIPPGIWRATLTLSSEGQERFINTNNETERVFTELTDGELPFNFEVVYVAQDDVDIYLINGEERILVEDVEFGRDMETLEDSVRINFPVFDTYIIGRYEENRIEGFWVVNYREQYRLPFKAEYGRSHRFTNLKKKPIADLTGRWKTTFDVGTDDEYMGIGEFVQDGNDLVGTFRTETGDYRYLQGTVQDNKAYLSTFDAAHAFLFQSKIMDDGSLIGSFRSGKHYLGSWEATRDDDYELADPDKVTYLRGEEQFAFEFENTEGKMISVDDPKFNEKPVLAIIFGTYCPNCRDAMTFVTSYLEDNPSVDFDVVGIAFEKYRDMEKTAARLKVYKEKMNIPFDLLNAGYYLKSEAVKKLPMLNKISSYPTLVFIDKEKNVRRIYTGFTGPATSKYDTFTTEFDEFVKQLVSE